MGVVFVAPPRIICSSHPLITQKANLDSHSWITSAAFEKFFHRLEMLCCYLTYS